MPPSLDAAAIALAVLAARAPQDAPSPGPLLIVPSGIELVSPPYVDPNGVTIRDEAILCFDEAVTRVAFVGWRRERPIGVQSALAPAPSAAAAPADSTAPILIEDFDYLSVEGVPAAGQPIRFRAGHRTSRDRERWCVIADGKKGGAEDWIGAVGTSRDGARTAWWRQPGARIEPGGEYSRGSVQLVVDGKAGGKWEDGDALEPPLFTRDGSKVAAAAQKAGKWYVAVVSKKGEERTGDGAALVMDVAWRPDGGALAYAVADLELGTLLPPRNGPARPRILGISTATTIVVDRLASGAAPREARKLDAGGDACGTPVWSADGERIFYKYIGPRIAGPLSGVGLRVDGAISMSPIGSVLGTPVLSADGRRFAVAARIDAIEPDDVAVHRDAERSAPDGHWMVVVDGKPGQEHERVADPVFSPDGTKVAFAAKDVGKWRVVVGDRESEPFDAVGPPTFSADGAWVVFGARSGREIRREVLASNAPGGAR